MPLRHTLLAVLFPILMAIQALATKMGQHDFPPLFMLGMRFALVAIILAPFIARPDKADFKWLIALSLFQGALMMGFFFLGVANTGTATATVVYQLNVPLSAILSFIALGERTSRLGITGIIVCVVGVVIAAWPDLNAAQSGVPIVALSALSMAIGNVLARFLGGMPPLSMNGWMALVSAPCVLIASVVFEKEQIDSLVHATSVGWISLATTVFMGGIAALTIWYFLLARYPVSQISPYGLMQPGFVAVLAWIALSEPITAWLVIGTLTTVAGVLLILRSSTRNGLSQPSHELSAEVEAAVRRYVERRRV